MLAIHMTKGIDTPSGELERADEPVSQRREWPQTRTFVRMLLIIAALATTLWLLHALREVFLLVVLSIFFAYLVVIGIGVLTNAGDLPGDSDLRLVCLDCEVIITNLS